MFHVCPDWRSDISKLLKVTFAVGVALLLGGCSQGGNEALDSFSDMVGSIREDHSPYTSDIDPLWSDFNLVNPESLPREVVNPYIGGGDSVSRTPTAATRGDDVVLPAESDVVIVALYSQSEGVLLSYKNFTETLAEEMVASPMGGLGWLRNHFTTITWEDFRKANEILNQNLARPAADGTMAKVLQQYLLQFCNLKDGDGNEVRDFLGRKVEKALEFNLGYTQYAGRTNVGDLGILKAALTQRGVGAEILAPNTGEDLFTFYKRVIDGKGSNAIYLCIGGIVGSGISCPGQGSYMGITCEWSDPMKDTLHKCKSLAGNIQEKCGGAAGFSSASFLGIADGVVVVNVAPETLVGNEDAVADGVVAWFDSNQ